MQGELQPSLLGAGDLVDVVRQLREPVGLLGQDRAGLRPEGRHTVVQPFVEGAEGRDGRKELVGQVGEKPPPRVLDSLEADGAWAESAVPGGNGRRCVAGEFAC